MNANALAQAHHDAAQALGEARRALYEAERAIKEAMTAENATAVPARAVDKQTGEIVMYELQCKREVIWDQGALVVLRELVSPEEWDALLTAPKPPPPRQLNMTKVKPLAKRGGDFKMVIDAAQRLGDYEVKVVAREETK